MDQNAFAELGSGRDAEVTLHPPIKRGPHQGSAGVLWTRAPALRAGAGQAV